MTLFHLSVFTLMLFHCPFVLAPLSWSLHLPLCPCPGAVIPLLLPLFLPSTLPLLHKERVLPPSPTQTLETPIMLLFCTKNVFYIVPHLYWALYPSIGIIPPQGLHQLINLCTYLSTLAHLPLTVFLCHYAIGTLPLLLCCCFSALSMSLILTHVLWYYQLSFFLLSFSVNE